MVSPITEECFAEHIDLHYAEIEIFGISRPASFVFKSTDPTAYRVSMSDWLSELASQNNYCEFCDMFTWGISTCDCTEEEE